MCELALSILAKLLLAKINTIVNERGTAALICRIVVVGTLLGVVLSWVGASYGLKPFEVHVASAILRVPKAFLEIGQDSEVILVATTCLGVLGVTGHDRLELLEAPYFWSVGLRELFFGLLATISD